MQSELFSFGAAAVAVGEEEMLELFTEVFDFA